MMARRNTGSSRPRFSVVGWNTASHATPSGRRLCNSGGVATGVSWLMDMGVMICAMGVAGVTAAPFSAWHGGIASASQRLRNTSQP
jgi:hypothetical protein